eukprot:GHVL01029404.1.p1 GENE.GHVL01029404.1~~GHVL01029404.1.p1  ORF type:complete len:493 (-),score=193.01 GHVL01029404.1:230-1708(-)
MGREVRSHLLNINQLNVSLDNNKNNNQLNVDSDNIDTPVGALKALFINCLNNVEEGCNIVKIMMEFDDLLVVDDNKSKILEWCCILLKSIKIDYIEEHILIERRKLIYKSEQIKQIIMNIHVPTDNIYIKDINSSDSLNTNNTLVKSSNSNSNINQTLVILQKDIENETVIQCSFEKYQKKTRASQELLKIYILMEKSLIKYYTRKNDIYNNNKNIYNELYNIINNYCIYITDEVNNKTKNTNIIKNNMDMSTSSLKNILININNKKINIENDIKILEDKKILLKIEIDKISENIDNLKKEQNIQLEEEDRIRIQVQEAQSQFTEEISKARELASSADAEQSYCVFLNDWINRKKEKLEIGQNESDDTRLQEMRNIKNESILKHINYVESMLEFELAVICKWCDAIDVINQQNRESEVMGITVGVSTNEMQVRHSFAKSKAQVESIWEDFVKFQDESDVSDSDKLEELYQKIRMKFSPYLSFLNNPVNPPPP